MFSYIISAERKCVVHAVTVIWSVIKNHSKSRNHPREVLFIKNTSGQKFTIYNACTKAFGDGVHCKLCPKKLDLLQQTMRHILENYKEAHHTKGSLPKKMEISILGLTLPPRGWKHKRTQKWSQGQVVFYAFS